MTMPSLQLQTATLSNRTSNTVFLSFPPAEPLDIPPNKDLIDFTANIQEIFFYNEATDTDNCYVLESDITAKPGSLILINQAKDKLSLEYAALDGSGKVQSVNLAKATHAPHNIHKQIKTPSQENPVDKLVLRSQFKSSTSPSQPFPDAAYAPTILLAAAAPSQDEPNVSRLRDLMNDLSKPPPEIKEQQKENKVIPAATGISIKPKEESSDPDLRNEVKQNYQYLEELMSFFTLLASGAIEAKERELGHEINVVREPVLFMEILANSYFKAPLSKALAGILNVTRGATNTFKNTCPRGEVHAQFLSELSQDFSFDKDAMKYLDRMLTQFVDSLKDVKVDIDQKIAFTLAASWVPCEKIPGSPYETVMPQIRVYFIEIGAKSFEQAAGKSEAEKKVTLDFQYTVEICKLVERRYLQCRENLDEAFRCINQSGVDEFRKKAIRSVYANSK